jgi:ribosomal protein S18 acetylase RimI-like enzyme
LQDLNSTPAGHLKKGHSLDLLNTANTVEVRPVQPADENQWIPLWDGYSRFYGREPEPRLTSFTWSRIMDPISPLHAVIAIVPEQGVVGMANYLIHESTSNWMPACFLQDLYVDPASRGSGVGERMIAWFVAQMKVRQWSKLYWNTRESNYRARGMYDKFTLHSGFLRYVLQNETKSRG